MLEVTGRFDDGVTRGRRERLWPAGTTATCGSVRKLRGRALARHSEEAKEQGRK